MRDFNEELFDRNLPTTSLIGFFCHHDQLTAMVPDLLHPGIDIGRVFDVGGDDAIARLPVDAVSHNAETFSRILGESDLITMPVHHGGAEVPQPFDVLVPGARELGVTLRLVGVLAQRIGDDTRERRHPGVVEEVPPGKDWKRVGVPDVMGYVRHGE
jgi:hypothetical protein